MPAAAVRCHRCRRVLVDPRWVPVGLGRVCAARLGLVLAPKPRVRQPKRGPVAEQPPLPGLDQELEAGLHSGPEIESEPAAALDPQARKET